MKRTDILATLGLALVVAVSAMLVMPAAAQQVPVDRTVLPIQEPQIPHSTVFDVRNATPPPRFEVKAPAKAPNVSSC